MGDIAPGCWTAILRRSLSELHNPNCFYARFKSYVLPSIGQYLPRPISKLVLIIQHSWSMVCSLISYKLKAHATHLTHLISHNSAHSTHLTQPNSHKLISHTFLTQLIPHNSNNPIHLTQLNSHNSSHTTDLTQLISLNSLPYHSTPTQLFSRS